MTKFIESKIKGAWIVDPVRYEDERGWFQELFKFSTVQSFTGLKFLPVQFNVSNSKQGVVRGIHYSIAPEGQAKYVSVLDGEIDDFIIDVRVGSPTFGNWEKVRISASQGNSVVLGADLAHAFQVISPRATVCYAVTAEFNPDAEKAIHPECATLNIHWDRHHPMSISPKDQSAPDTMTQKSNNCLPVFR